MGLLATGCSLFGKGREEQPTYQVVVKKGDKEIRKYESILIAKTTISGSFEDAQKKGFRILAGYIFGNNKSQQKIKMTTPVVQQPESEMISMTAPVVMAPKGDKTWTMSFSMPSHFTIDSLPVPNDKRVEIQKIEPRFVASITFSGFWGESRNAQEAQKVLEWIKSFEDYEIISLPMFAGYNPPWTLPFLRRNEILIELRTKKNVE
jgi:hypothetical protein